MSAQVLLADDDVELSGMLTEYLEREGFGVTAVHDGEAAARLALSGGYQIVVLDVMMPKVDGIEALRLIRQASRVPVIMLTARGDDVDRIVGLELGADDYLPKPFNPRELLARIKAILRRRHAGPDRRPLLRFGRLEIDREARVVRLDGRERPLTSHQFDLLAALAESAGRVLSRDALMERVRGDALEAFDRSIDVHVSRIRAAIEDDPRHPRRILTVRGAGYVFARAQDDD